MKKLLTHLCLAAVLLTGTVGFSGCTAIKQAVALKNCNYSYNKVDNVSLLGFSSLKDMTSLQGALSIAQAFTGSGDRLPLGFTVHLNVENPNNTTAAIDQLYYKVSLDGIEIADGTTTQDFLVVGGGRADLPLNLNVDLMSLIKSDKRKAVTKVVKNFVGLGSESTEVRVDIKPTLRIGNRSITSPVFIPVTFTYPRK